MGSLMMMRYGDSGEFLFPDFDKILDFTSAGGESSTYVNVNGDTDLEYKIIIRNLSMNQVNLRLNNDSTTGIYGRQYLFNSSGTISSGRGTLSFIYLAESLCISNTTILTPAGFIKTCFRNYSTFTAGTTMKYYSPEGIAYNSTANITTLNFFPNTGNFTSGTRIIVYRRRVNT